MGWVDDKLNKKPSGPQPLPHPGDPGYSVKEVKERSKKGYKSPTPKPSVNAYSGSLSDAEKRTELSRQALRDAVANTKSVDPLPVIDPVGDLNEIYKQLLNSLSNSPSGLLSDKQLRKIAEDQIKMQFDPQIKALKQDMAERKKRYALNKAEVKDLYADLANQYRKERGNSVDAYNDSLNDNDRRSQEFDDTNQRNFEKSLNYQTEEFNKLGIGDVATVTYPEQREDMQYQATLNNADSDAFARYLSAQRSSTEDYYSKMAANAGYHGAETIEDLLDELNTNLNSTSSQITSLRGQKGSQLQNLIMQLQQQQQQKLAEAQQQRFQNLLSTGKFGLDIKQLSEQLQRQQQEQVQKQQQQDKSSYNSGLLGANQMLANSSDPQRLSGIFQELLQQQPFREDRFLAADGTIVKLSAPQAAQYAAKLGQQMGLSPNDITALVNATYAYFGRLGR